MDEKRDVRDESKEVDFEPLIAWFLDQMSRISNGFRFIKNAIKTHLTIVLVFSIMGGIAGISTYFFAPKKYVAHLQLITKDTDNQTNKSLIDQLGKLAQDDSYGSLANELNISKEAAAMIYDLVYLDHTKTEVNDEDTVVEKRNFFVEIEITTNEQLKEYQNAIVNWIENQPLTSELRNKRLNIINAKISQLESELVRLDSLKYKVERSIEPRGKRDGLVYGEPINPIAIFKQYETTYDHLIYKREELKTLKSVKVVSGFIPNEKPIFPRMRHIAFSILSGLILGVVFALYRYKPSSQ